MHTRTIWNKRKRRQSRRERGKGQGKSVSNCKSMDLVAKSVGHVISRKYEEGKGDQRARKIVQKKTRERTREKAGFHNETASMA